MISALITGGLGFIGSHIARKLLKDNVVDKVVLLDSFGGYVNPLRPEFFDYRKLRLKDLEDKTIIERGHTSSPHLIYKLLLKYQPEYIFHLAAIPLASLQNITTSEAIEGNVLSTSSFLESIHDLKKTNGYCPKRFLYTSSSMIYGDFIYNPAEEKHPTSPKELYGTMKLAGEIVTKGLSRLYGIPYTIIRPSAVYGPTDMNRRVSQIFIEKAFRGETLKIAGKDESLDFTYVKDTANGFVMACIIEEGKDETFNITSGHAFTLLEYVEELNKHFPNLKYEILDRDDSKPKRGTLSIKKAENLLGFKPDYDLSRGVKEYVEFVKLHNPMI